MQRFKTFLILYSSLFFFFSCGQKNKLASTETKEVIEETYTVKLSPFAAFFKMDLEKEWNSSKSKNFIPSKELRDKYGIGIYNNQYLVHGFVQTNDQYNEVELEALGISTGRPFGNSRTINIPLNNFFNFLKLEGVDYFEMNAPAELK